MRARSWSTWRASLLALAACAGALQSLPGCGQDVQVGFDSALANGGSAGFAAGGTAPSGGFAGEAAPPVAGAASCQPTVCEGKVRECGNCDDDDADGRVDALDPECLGPCDDDELGLSSGLAGNQAATCRQDCYFDGDSGQGNDQCSWSHACDELSVAPDYPPSGQARCEYVEGAEPMGLACAALSEAQPDACLQACLPLVPNGCDCFGCCELPARSGSYHFIGRGRGSDGCQLDQLDDAAACPPCTPVRGCLNTCERCEACVGGSPESDCTPDAACAPGRRACPDGGCRSGEYCITGCCVIAPPR